MIRLIYATLVLGFATLAIATVVGLLAPWSIVADAFTHFRAHVVVAALLIAAAAILIDKRMALAAAVLALANAGLTLSFVKAPHQVAAGGKPLKVVTINVLYRVHNDDQVLALLAAERPDVVLLQELNDARASLLQRLAAEYPWQVSCMEHRRCDVAIVSRHRWQEAQSRPTERAKTRLAWARFGPEWGNLLVASVHLNWPLLSDQTRQLQDVRDMVVNHRGPVVVAGDLNAAPWSAAVQSFTRAADLRSAGGFTPTWPRRTFVRGKSCLLCVPQLQLDHIFVSEHVRVIGMHAGTDVGSDHLPLIAQLELPARVAAAR